MAESNADAERRYFSTRSGLTPVEKFTLADHKRAYWLILLGTGYANASYADLRWAWLSTTLAATGPVEDLQRAYFVANSGLTPADKFTVDDHRYALYTNAA